MASTMRTFSGRIVDVVSLKMEDICIEDIAHHLSLTCRYAGACPDFYSVAQHSIIVALMMQRHYGIIEAARAGLFHDGSEAYLHDITSPLKHHEVMTGYRQIESVTSKLINIKFNISPHWAAAVKPFDKRAYRDEVETWWGGKQLIKPVPPKEAERMFLAAYRNFNEHTPA